VRSTGSVPSENGKQSQLEVPPLLAHMLLVAAFFGLIIAAQRHPIAVVGVLYLVDAMYGRPSRLADAVAAMIARIK
jgi:hypothetical protein